MKRALALMATLLALLAGPAQAQLLYQEGKHYQRLPVPVPTAHPGKVEVVEAFSYGCIHCYRIEPLVTEWKKTLPADVVFVALPVVWSNQMQLHAQALYAAEELGVLDVMHPALFRAIHEDKNPLATEDALAALFAKTAGVDAAAFARAMKSFGVTARTKQAMQRTRDYRISGTPSLVVNGRYLITGSGFEGDEKGVHAGMLKAAEFLIALEAQPLRQKPAAPAQAVTAQ